MNFKNNKMCRRFVVADIHGCAATFAALLAQLDVQRCDTLYLLGDYVDRGPHSKLVLDRILALQADGYALRPLRGNHEQLLLDALDDHEVLILWKENGGCSTLQDFGVTHPAEIPQHYLDFLASLPLLHRLDDYLLVHAGLDFRQADPLGESRPIDLLWTRDYWVDRSKLAGLTLVTGHSVTPLFSIKESLATCHIKLDNGCYIKGEMAYGALVALDLDRRELAVAQNCDEVA